ncbi:MAG: glycosyltransferase family 39 protein [Candidatus Omnitrophica bacterium]|nr:glycosyltransferase family 39 protein [Candidatus Omnitrophota bacterium]
MAAPFKKTVLRCVPLALCLLGFLAYGQTLRYPFVHDEIISIQNNPLITHFDWNEIIHGTGTAAVKWSSSINNAYYRPFLELFYRIEYALFGLHPAGYHFLNIVVHILNSLLVYRLMNIFLDNKKGSAFAVSLLFLLHPVQTESVACVSGISNLLFAFFSLAGIYFYCLAAHQRANRRIYWASLAASFFALLTKEQAVMLPVLIFGLDMVMTPREGRWSFEEFRRIAGHFAVLACYFILRKFLMAGGAVPFIPLNNELLLRIGSIPGTLLMYSGIIFYPSSLHYYRSVDILAPAVVPAEIFLVVVLALVLVIRRTPDPHRRILVAGAGWFIISLLPVLNIVPVINEYSLILTAEHFLYLPLVGVLMFVFGIGSFLMGRIRAQRQGVCAAVVIGGLALVSLVATVRQNTVWAGEVPLLERTVRFEPHLGRARMLLADAYYHHHEYNKAIIEYRRALDIMNGYLDRVGRSPARAVYAAFIEQIYIGLANSAMALGDFQQFLEGYKQAAIVRNHPGQFTLFEEEK